MLYAKIKFPYSTFVLSDKLEALSDVLGKPKDEIADKVDGVLKVTDKGYELTTWKEHEVDLEKMLAVGVPFEVAEQIQPSLMVRMAHIVDDILKMRDDMRSYAATILAGGKVESQQFNSRVAVHVPNLGLLNVNEVTHLDDCCTDELAKWLGDGWRILAICPQPNQRRPDYILGRTCYEERQT